MVKSFLSIIVSFLLIIGAILYEQTHIREIFSTFRTSLISLYQKTENQTASYQDGEAVRMFWDDKKRSLHIWVSHTSIETVDYQLNEALGYLFEGKYDDVLPKIEVLIKIAEKIPKSYAINLQNVF
jgi:hypothetical protein